VETFKEKSLSKTYQVQNMDVEQQQGTNLMKELLDDNNVKPDCCNRKKYRYNQSINLISA
jgi:hypothetical protein